MAAVALTFSASVATTAGSTMPHLVSLWRRSCASRAARKGWTKASRLRAMIAAILGSSSGCRFSISASKPSRTSLRCVAESHRYS